MTKIMSVLIIVILTLFLASCIEKNEEDSLKEIEPEYPKEFNVQYQYDFDHEIDIKENEYRLRGCYPETDLYLPFSVEDKNWFYNEILSQDLLNYRWTFGMTYLKEKKISCPQSTTNDNLFSLKIYLNNQTNEIIGDEGDCCCFINYTSYGVIDEIRGLNETEIYTEINDPIVVKIYREQKELRIFSEKIKSMIDSKKIKFNITEPKQNSDCGYI